jgi:hypothetical protein
VRLEQPPRIRRSFLTWAFFLAQVSAAELLATGAAKAQDDEASGNSASQPEAPSAPLADDALQQTIEVAQAPAVGPPSGSIVGSPATPHLDMPDATHLLPLPPGAEHTPPIGGIGGIGGSASTGLTPHIGSGGSTSNSLPTLLPDIGGAEQTTPPAIDVHIGLSPLLGFDLQIDTGGLISGVGLDLGNLPVGPLETVTGLVDLLVNDLTTDVGNLLNNDLLGLGKVLESGPLNLSELTGLTLSNGIAGLLNGGEAGANPQTPTPLISLSTHDGELSAPGLLSGGMINFPTIGTAAPLDALYAQGQHTDYNIALHDDAAIGNGDAPATAPQADIAGILPEALAHEAPPPADDSAAALLSPLDEFLTRPTL